jgi:microcystin-dependent protein
MRATSRFALVGTTFGVGDGSTTFNVPDLRDRVVAGKGDMGGVAASRLGNVLASTTLGNAAGAERGTIAQANLPSVTLVTTIVDPGHAHNYQNDPTQQGVRTDINQATVPLYNQGVNATTTTSATGITASTALGGSKTPLSLLQPTIILNKILRVL